ncbi:MAG: Plug domain-containing protein [Chitinophagaceae bacterium]
MKAVRANDKAPFTKTNLTKKDIEKVNLGQDLPFILNQTPSVVVHSDAGNGIGYTGIRIRGTDGTRINVTLNGIPYNDAESQISYFVDLPDITSSVKQHTGAKRCWYFFQRCCCFWSNHKFIYQ